MAAAAMSVVANARSVASIMTANDGFNISSAGKGLRSQLDAYRSLEHYEFEVEYCTPAGASYLESQLQDEVYADSDRDVDVMCGCEDGFAECSATFNEEECAVSVCTIERTITLWRLLDDIAPFLLSIHSTTEYTSGGANMHSTSALLAVTEEEGLECLGFSVDHNQEKVTSQMLCAKEDGKSSCYGDSGGPLLIKGADSSQDLQIGVVSWGVGCGEDAVVPGVYARVSSAYDWIRTEVCKRSVDPPASFECDESAADDTERSGHAKQERIVGGEDAKVGRYPYAVGLESILFGEFCGGSLIAPDVVLSAAHCMNTGGFVPYNVIIGRLDLEERTDGESLAMAYELKHPNYDRLSTENDFALIYLASPTYNYEVVQLNQDDNIPQSGDAVTAIGYGYTDMTPSKILQEVEMKALSNKECNEIPEWETVVGRACNSCEVCEQDGSSVKVKADCDNLFPTAGRTWDCNYEIDFTYSLLQCKANAFSLERYLSEVMPDGDMANIECNCQSETRLVQCDVEFLEEICLDGLSLCWKSSQVQLWNVATSDLKSVTYKSEYTQGPTQSPESQTDIMTSPTLSSIHLKTSAEEVMSLPPTLSPMNITPSFELSPVTPTPTIMPSGKPTVNSTSSSQSSMPTTGSPSISPSRNPTANPLPFPSSSPTVHPFSGYKGVGSDGECTDVNGVLYSYVQYSGVAAPKNCASRCSKLGLSNQVGLGASMADICRCYFDGTGTAPEVAVADQTSQNGGSGPITGVNDSPGWQCYRLVIAGTISPTPSPSSSPTVVASTSTLKQRACQTMAECDTQRQELGIESFLAGTDLPFKGCFMEEGKTYFGLGGSQDDMSTEISGNRERLWCVEEIPVIPCLRVEECDNRRKELGIETFQAGTDFPSKGCFIEGTNSFFGMEGTAEEMSTDDLPGSQKRLFCVATNGNLRTNTSSAVAVFSVATLVHVMENEDTSDNLASSSALAICFSFGSAGLRVQCCWQGRTRLKHPNPESNRSKHRGERSPSAWKRSVVGSSSRLEHPSPESNDPSIEVKDRAHQTKPRHEL
ncbi:hypothetical protein THAOC_33916 [Thalassiosira oceanica]|uniref:Peptidase S1 domain-containing protein n=1 Tax=Thalassiosira oceanica TaxID=159749 RepID=K0R608_THAOC|nr:hypothetical protein THAOC_33916 [Thalassiosira oceanica]|eukprot:EJK47364.1 hypothetical protein THAOC_33916 [Thalassiosira oceanica]